MRAPAKNPCGAVNDYINPAISLLFIYPICHISTWVEYLTGTIALKPYQANTTKIKLKT